MVDHGGGGVKRRLLCVAALLCMFANFVGFLSSVDLFKMDNFKLFFQEYHLKVSIILDPDIIGILTFINTINTLSENLKAGKDFIFQHFMPYEQSKIHTQSR